MRLYANYGTVNESTSDARNVNEFNSVMSVFLSFEQKVVIIKNVIWLDEITLSGD